MKHLGDITKINGSEAPVVDVIIGGSPCQDLSIAGKRAGLAGERSGLYMEQIRIIKEMRKADVLRGKSDVDVRPRYMVWENVPGAFSSNGGKDFAAVLEEAIRIAEPEAPNIPVPEKGWPTSGCFWDELGGWSVAWRVLDAQFWGVPQRRRRIALVADFGGLSASEILFVREGVSGDFDSGEEKREKSSENTGGCAVGAIGCDLYNLAMSGDKAVSLNTNANATGAGPTVAVAFHLLQDPIHSFNVSPCIGQGNGRTGQATTGIFAQCFSAGGFGSYTEGIGTLRASGGDYGGGTETLVRFKRIIRKMTPLECERLQGFKDGWTDIGEWIDSKGKKHKAVDSPRYKALGNSIAIPPWKWVLKRLCACYERDATMASLFDGIGGFPYIWEQLNGKGSCLWASEIEEFPMAVTKARFGE